MAMRSDHCQNKDYQQRFDNRYSSQAHRVLSGLRVSPACMMPRFDYPTGLASRVSFLVSTLKPSSLAVLAVHTPRSLDLPPRSGPIFQFYHNPTLCL